MEGQVVDSKCRCTQKNTYLEVSSPGLLDLKCIYFEIAQISEAAQAQWCF